MADEKTWTRRKAAQVIGAAAGAAALGVIGLTAQEEPPSRRPPAPPRKEPKQTMSETTTSRMPAIFLPHGGGPWPFSNDPLFGGPKMWERMAAYMKGLGQIPPTSPKAILVISAHWEEAVPTVMSSPKPPMLYDYYGFPPETYKVQWPAPGAPALAGEIQSLLQNAGFKTGSDGKRGFDHGTFVPLKLTYPNPEIPALQLSLKQGLDPKEHIKIGRALAPLRDQGVFLIGSGMSYHNLRALMQNLRGGGITQIDDSKAFDQWLTASMLLDADSRETRLVEWAQAPKARECHPREEHLLPLHVIAGAAENDSATMPYQDVVMGAHLSAVHFG